MSRSGLIAVSTLTTAIGGVRSGAPALSITTTMTTTITGPSGAGTG